MQNLAEITKDRNPLEVEAAADDLEAEALRLRAQAKRLRANQHTALVPAVVADPAVHVTRGRDAVPRAVPGGLARELRVGRGEGAARR